MNEKIRALAGQSGFDVTHHKWIFCNDNVGEGECHELLAKFAELIAQECADICMEMAAKCAGLPGDGALAKDCAHWIKKDFGIEQ